MAFKLTYTDGQESDYDDGTKWEVDGGVLKLGREDGNWSGVRLPGSLGHDRGRQRTEQRKRTRTKDEKDDKATTRTIRTTTTEAQTSMREPMMTVRSSGRLKYAAASAVM